MFIFAHIFKNLFLFENISFEKHIYFIKTREHFLQLEIHFLKAWTLHILPEYFVISTIRKTNMWKMGALTAAHLTPRLCRIYKILQCVKDIKLSWGSWLAHVLCGAKVACLKLSLATFLFISLVHWQVGPDGHWDAHSSWQYVPALQVGPATRSHV